MLTGVASDGSGATDTLLGIENANGSGFADELTGNDAANALSGLSGNDTLRGNGGADVIDGGDGNDLIAGGAGDDTLTGGAGSDRYFVVDSGSAIVNVGNDTITDFAPDDVIDLSPVPTISSLAELQATSRQEGADTVIDLGGGNSIRLTGVALGNLMAANFVFATPIVGTANNDSLQGTLGNDRILGLGGNDFLEGRAGSDVLDGGDGADIAFYLLDANAVIANLSAAPITVGGITVQPNTARDGSGATDTLISIEAVAGSNFGGDTLVGGAGADSLNGFGGADTLIGGGGDDLLSGGAGVDIMDGGAGFDVVLFGSDPAVLGSSLLQIAVNGDGSITSFNTSTLETETIVNVEMAVGSLGNDSLIGNAGNDFLGGNFGSDVINGGAGIDTAVYVFNAGTVLTIDLASGTATETFTPPPPPSGPPPPTFSATDTLISIENVRGSASNETIIGNSGNNVLEGYLGNDLLRGGSGDDTLNGGATVSPTQPGLVIPVEVDGTDTVDYSTDPTAVTINLLTGTATDGFGGTDTLLSIENANGSGFDDTITGNDAVNVLAGLGGNDTLRGNGGADVIDGGLGNDSITGGAGNDTLTGGAGTDRYFVVDPGQTTVNIGNDTITDFAGDVIDLTPVPTITSLSQVLAISRQEGADAVIDLGGGNSIRLANVALGSLTAANFVFAGPPPAPIVGTAGADMLNGTSGNDTILGLGGNDILTGLAGSDVLDGGDGTDAAVYLTETGSIIANLSAAPITVGGVTVQSNTVRDSSGNTDTLISIESIIGTNLGNDTLIGSARSESLSGAGGVDTISAGDGNDFVSGGGAIDSLDGGAGFDILLFSGDPAPLNGPLLQITLNPDGSVTSVNPVLGETETGLINFEMVIGSLGNDTITGTSGNDFIGGGFGSDVVNGGAGTDTAVYTFNPGTVLVIDLASGTSSETFTATVGPPGSPPTTFTASDTLISIENVRGSASNETIIGNSGNNVLEGYTGNDVLRGAAGNDVLNGGASVLLTHPEAVVPVELDGSDTADYSTDGPNGVTVNLVTGVATDGSGGTDTLLSIENATGSSFNDTITGNDAANVLSGLAGNDSLLGNAGADTINGGDGNDLITGGAGNDTLTGGAGNDRYFIVDPGQTTVNIGNDTITDLVPGDVIDLTPVASITSLAQLLAISRQEGFDTVIDLGGGNSIRLANVVLGSLTAANFAFAGGPQFPPGSIVGTDGNDLLQGTPGADVIFALGGNDAIALSGASSDTVDGGDGTDSILYSNEPGPLVVNLSAAPITVGGITVQPNTVRDANGGIDTLVSIENITISTINQADFLMGSAGANSLSGGLGADTIFGGDGLDTISGGAGIDVLDGGAGFDIVLFGGDQVAINAPGLQIAVNADGSITSVNPITGETEAAIVNFEMLSGSQGNDIITGNAGNNMLGGGFGSDIIDGGAGIDTVNYQFNLSPTPGTMLTVDLAAGTSFETLTTPSIPLPGIPTQSFTASDTLINIENVSGTTFADNLYGDAGDNVLQGFLGDDVLRGNAGNDTLDGNVFTLFTHLENTGPSPADGSDTADYATDPNSVVVNLSTGIASDGYGGTDTLVSIENATGSAFGDTLTGDGLANVLSGLAGADTLSGGAGDDRLRGGSGVDVIDGGAGFDIVDFSADAVAVSAAGLSITIEGTTVTAVNAALGETEVATNVEGVVGSLGDDIFTGGAGDDSYFDVAGDDQFDGGGGSDTVRFGTASTADLVAGTSQGAGYTLVLTNVENLTGSANADTLRGNAAANVLVGGLGDDVLTGRGGADTLIGGTPGVTSTDIDTVDYSDDGASVTVNLATGTAVDSGGATDTLVSIERAIGSQFADTLIGDGGSNVLTGLGGNDLLTGGAGVDTFMTTADAGGNAAFGNDVVTDFNVAQDIVNLRAFGSTIRSFADVTARLTQDGADALLTVSAGNTVRLQNVNAVSLTANNFALLSLNIVGTAASETLTGDIGDDTIQGLGGNDTLNGLAGNDTLDGGTGADTLNGGSGNDTLLDPDPSGTTMIGGAGNDTINGGTPDYATDPAGIIANLSTAPFDVNGNGSLIVAARTVRDGYGGTDTLAGTISQFEASYFNDTVVGGAANETFFLFAGNDRALGMDGSDQFFGGSGNDYVDGGAGFDTLSYSAVTEDGGSAAANQGIRLNLSNVAVDIGGGVVLDANTGIDQYGHLDTVLNIEVIQGTNLADVIVGGATTAILNGFDGNDTLLGGAGGESLNGGQGNDIIDGGAGFDSVSYSGTTGSVVNLVAQTATDGLGGTDVIRNVESINGSQFADDFTGDDSNNNLFGNAGNDVLRGLGGSDVLDGGDGNDVLEGGNGNDQLSGGRNNDTLTGGAGQDFFSFIRTTTPTPTDFGVDTVTDFSVAEDILNVGQVPELTTIDAILARATQNAQGVLITINPANSIQLNGLTLANLSQMQIFFAPIVATPGDDVLDGGSASDFINGGGGNDIINGRGGPDTLDGGDGNDTLNGGDSTDQLFGGLGNDILNGDADSDFMDGGSGDDTLTGGAGGDAFRTSVSTGGVGYGRDVFTDFSVADDRLDLSSIPSMTSRDALNAVSAQAGPDVVITIDPVSSITLRNFTLAQLGAANVTFAPFTGTPGNDVLNGSSGADFITGLGGDDFINGNGGNDSLNGGDGNDILNGGAGADGLFGGNGNDTLDGGVDYDNLDGGAGNDTLTGGTDSTDFFRATVGHDVITDLTSGIASDFIDFSAFPVLTSLEALLARAAQVGPDVVITIDASSSLTLRNFALAQLQLTNMSFAPIVGTAGNDVLSGSAGGETIDGQGGDDVIDGNGGNDVLFGSAGNDTLSGGSGVDNLNGGDGNDILNGGADNDYLVGEAGNDTVTGGAASDIFVGGPGHDVITDFAANEDVLQLGLLPSVRGLEELLAVSRQEGPDVVIDVDPSTSLTLRNLTLAQLAGANYIQFATIVGTPGNDTLDGTSSSDNVNALAGDDTVNGLAGNDSIFGQEGADTLNGGDGGDFLAGGAGNDELHGDAGGDVLDGNAGDDRLTGGAGLDNFRITSTDGPSYGRDVITDFVTTDDVLDLSQVATMTTRSALTSAAAQSGSDVVITLDSSSSVTIQNFTLTQLDEASVFFAPFNGTEGNDTLNGSDEGETMRGLGGDDVINGFGGGDQISGDAGNDTLDGGAGSDSIGGGDGNDTLLGGAEHDFLLGGAGDDVVTGGSGNDTFRFEAGRDTITDFATTDDFLDLSFVPSMSSPAALAAASAQVGTDVVITFDANNTLTLQNFTLAQLATANVQFAPLVGTDNSETLEGSATHDSIFGRGGDDVLNGGVGNDQLFGEDGNDTLNGGFGYDQLNGGLGNDTLNGGTEIDIADFSFNAQTHGVVADLMTMTALDDGAGGIDNLIGIENLWGSRFDDRLTGDGNDNNLFGSGGNDELHGLNGNDSLQGADGNDVLRGDAGNDFLYGDAGDDLFVFAAGDGADNIQGFVAGAGSDDVIDLQALPGFDSFADVLAATNDDAFGNSIIDLGGGNTIMLAGVTESALHADDFLL